MPSTSLRWIKRDKLAQFNAYVRRLSLKHLMRVLAADALIGKKGKIVKIAKGNETVQIFP